MVIYCAVVTVSKIFDINTNLVKLSRKDPLVEIHIGFVDII